MSDPRITAVFVFNHKYEKNVARLERHYAPLFSRRRYIMPFAESTDPNVISVREASWYFGGHIAQASHGYLDDQTTHYAFIADDLVLNPRLNEANLIAEIGLAPDTGYIKSLASNDELRYRWRWSADAAAAIWMYGKGFHWATELPPAAQTQARFEAMGFRFPSPRPRSAAELRTAVLGTPGAGLTSHALRLLMTGRRAPYPLLSGYADFVIVPAGAVRRFVHYCGVLSAMNVFAEVAVPTALAMSCDHVMTEITHGITAGDVGVVRNPQARLTGVELWGSQVTDLGNRLHYSWPELLNTFPEDWLYLHPVKLSQWK